MISIRLKVAAGFCCHSPWVKLMLTGPYMSRTAAAEKCNEPSEHDVGNCRTFLRNIGTRLENSGSDLGRYHLGLSDVGCSACHRKTNYATKPDFLQRATMALQSALQVTDSKIVLGLSADCTGPSHSVTGSGPYQFKTQLNTPQPRAKLLGRLRV